MNFKTQVLQPTDAAIQKAAEYLKSGELVGMPTETVYGLAASAYDEQAIKKIFTAKGRPQDNPLIVHITNMDMLAQVVQAIPNAAKILAKKFWPGPLTMIMPKGDRVAPAVSAGLQTVAVRMPSHPVAAKLIEKSGLPLAAPSANLSGSPSPTTAQYVLQDMNGRIPLIIDGGECEVGVESTVIDLTSDVPMLLRPGYITPAQLSLALGCEVQISHAVLQQLKKGEKANSPGMKYKHYAPNAEVIIVSGDRQSYIDYVNAHAQQGVQAMCFTEDTKDLSVPFITYGSVQSPKQQAQQIFTALRHLDEHGAKTVYAHAPQKTDVALAVYNRLLRAAAFRVIEL